MNRLCVTSFFIVRISMELWLGFPVDTRHSQAAQSELSYDNEQTKTPELALFIADLNRSQLAESFKSSIKN